ncbi:uncharacterized protein PRCAT00000632001 [Priceomyces carsonii]|uniref:uncharacterized protein n=1 Tax=Priceomyces carsonii TaxID=28549 RepID=UPI002ED91F45|nr:unnamed protein product [Priceomyces carsonii]
MVVINNLSFNQGHSCISISTSKYHKIFNCEPFGEFYSSNDSTRKKSISLSEDSEQSTNHKDNEVQEHPTAYLKMLFSTSLTIIVPSSKEKLGNRLLKIYNLKQNLKICELTFPSNIIDIRLNRKRLLVFLEIGQIYIYDLSCVRLVKVLEVEPYVSNESNERLELVGDLSADDSSYLILPLSIINDQTDLFNAVSASRTSTPVMKPSDSTVSNSLDSLIELTQKNNNSHFAKKEDITLEDLKKDSDGWVLVYDSINLKPILIYKAHDSSIAKMTISNDNKKIATASTKGTIIRVCHLDYHHLEIQKKAKISQITNLRRGHHLTRINTLSFNQDHSVLGCGSESGTIHFFKLRTSGESEEEITTNESEADDESSKSSEDLNENLANLLISKPSAHEAEDKGYFNFTLKTSSKLINNHYTKSIIKKLPYKNYFENLIWEPPRRSFAFIKLPEYSPLPNHTKNKVEIGFSGLLILIASYQTGNFYQYQLPKDTDDDKREECNLINQYSLV